MISHRELAKIRNQAIVDNEIAREKWFEEIGKKTFEWLNNELNEKLIQAAKNEHLILSIKSRYWTQYHGHELVYFVEDNEEGNEGNPKDLYNLTVIEKYLKEHSYSVSTCKTKFYYTPQKNAHVCWVTQITIF